MIPKLADVLRFLNARKLELGGMTAGIIITRALLLARASPAKPIEVLYSEFLRRVDAGEVLHSSFVTCVYYSMTLSCAKTTLRKLLVVYTGNRCIISRGSGAGISQQSALE